MKKLILHVGKLDKFIPSYCELIKNEFNSKEHAFFFFFSKDVSYVDVRNNDILVKSVVDLFKLEVSLYKARKIILHGFFSKEIFLLILLQPWLISKIYWGIWGGDLYFREIKKKNIKNRMIEFLRKIVLTRIKHYITFIDGDFDVARTWYNPSAIRHSTFGYESNIFKKPSNGHDFSKDTINILVGNSATDTNRHEEVFKLLKPLVLKNFKIIVPLSYGSKAYADKVLRLGKELFGEAFVPVLEFMAYDKYMRLLNSVDIAIMGHNRQQAMGNIITLLGLGKKVFLDSSITTWSTLNRLGLKVFDLNGIELSRSFSESEKNKSIIQEQFSRSKLIEDWRKIFEY